MTINYMEVRQSLAVLFSKMILVGLLIIAFFLMSVTIYGLGYGQALQADRFDFYMIYIIFQLLNFGSQLLIVALWTNKFYRISPDSVSSHEGVIHKKTDIISTRTVSSVNLYQSFAGRILNFGSIRIECMFSKQVIFLRSVPKPHFYRKTIQTMIAEAARSHPVMENLRIQ